MPALDSALRNQLSRVVLAARAAAEKGAREALEALAVSYHEPHASMEPEQRALRRHLRAHGRQLGDRRDAAAGTQTMDRLVQECAYEHWHRMLFTRFLAENQLLIEPASGVAITLEECEDLARAAREDPWEKAAGYAQRMLPRIFRADDPVLQVALPPETRQELERLLESLPAAVFTADDSLGWTYQFWQAQRKDEVNRSGVKIGADELPAVTQLFTEHYMVLFLLHNTLGAWWAGKALAGRPELLDTAESEEVLRAAVAIPGCSFEYLRFVREAGEDGSPGPWRIGAGTFESWPRTARELKVLDPCCGSGHFLLSALGLLARLRMAKEGLDLQEALEAVLRDNLYGLELDPRCTQIAAFSLALYCWKAAGGMWDLPPLNVACCGLSVGSSEEEWLDLAGEDPHHREGLKELHELFLKAPVHGSLIDPTRMAGGFFPALAEELVPLLERVLDRVATDEEREAGIAARGMVEAVRLLLGSYTLVITNPPYLGRGQQDRELIEFADKHEKEAKKDLATIFLSRALRWVRGTGTVAMVLPQNWLFLTSYKKLRERMLRACSWNAVARLGPGAFETITGEVVQASLIAITASSPADDHRFLGIDASANRGEEKIPPHQKARILAGEPNPHRAATCASYSQEQQLGNPEHAVLLVPIPSGTRIGDLASVHYGSKPGQTERTTRCFWEFRLVDGSVWRRMVSTPDGVDLFSGRTHLCMTDEEILRNQIVEFGLRGARAWGRDGIIYSKMTHLPSGLYCGEFFDDNTNVIVPNDPHDLPALVSYARSGQFNRDLRQVNQKLNVTRGLVQDFPIDLEDWRGIGRSQYPNGLPEPQSSDPTQWLFHGHPAGAEPATMLHVAVGRLLGYHWPPELDSEMRLAEEARAWVARCAALDGLADEDGIVCLSASRGERAAADRLRELLAVAFGSEWSAAKERELLAAAASGGRPAESLEGWLRERFFEEHCKLFHHRPFVWHLWDGRQDGFHCLVNAHRLTGPGGEGRRTLEAIAYSYLGDWIERQKADQQAGREGADARLAAALDLRGQLEKILEGEPPYDLFVRWKPLHRQALGWEPDIDDGIRLNIRPFLKAALRNGGRTGAGILRWRPNVKWGKDRGNEPCDLRPREDFPWFWGCDPDREFTHRRDFNGGPDFDGQRWNDLHYSLAVKRSARAAKGVPT